MAVARIIKARGSVKLLPVKSVRGESGDRRSTDQTWSSTVPWTEDQTRSSTVRSVHKGRLMHADKIRAYNEVHAAVQNFLYKLFLRHGCPQEIVSDQGREFCNSLSIY